MKNVYKNKKNKSGYLGVYYKKDTKKWAASITVNKKKIYLGTYDTPEEAYKVYQKKAIELNVVRENYITEEEKNKRKKIYKKKWTEDHKEEYKQYWKNRFKKIYTEKSDEILRKTKNRKQITKYEIMLEYGGKCQCCGEDTIEFLTIDVIEKGGSKLHKEVGYGESFYRWLKKNGYPKDNFQCLCMNCNFAKGMYDKCPHEILKEMEAINAKRS